LASDADIPPAFLSGIIPWSTEDPADDGGEGAFGFQDNPPGLGRGAGPGPGPVVEEGFSNAAILSRNEPGLGFGGGG